MKKTVIILAHPDINSSIANKTIIDTVKAQLPDVEIRDLTALYGKDFKIDVTAEQEAVRSADTVVFQFPFFWYSVPGIMKQYIDDVFTHGFAINSKGPLLTDKTFIVSLTAGGTAEEYAHDEPFQVEDHMPPFKSFANLCGMTYGPEITSLGYHFITPDTTEEQIQVLRDNATNHSERLIDTLNNL